MNLGGMTLPTSEILYFERTIDYFQPHHWIPKTINKWTRIVEEYF